MRVPGGGIIRSKVLARVGLFLLALLLPVLVGSAWTQPATSSQSTEPRSKPGGEAGEPEPSRLVGEAESDPKPVGKKALRNTLSEDGPVATDWDSQIDSVGHALVRLPIAAVFSAALAFRPRRRGTPPRQPAVIQTQIILAIVGAIVMLVVGASLARAFGIVGAAGLIRYRAKIDDPKDAGVMLSTLAIGLAAGVGLYLLVAFAAVFVLGVLWLVESFDHPHTLFHLTITAKDPSSKRAAFEAVLHHYKTPFELRSTSPEDLCYEVKVPVGRNTDSISNAISAIDSKQSIDIKWEKQKEKG
jgi:hypothetical protein